MATDLTILIVDDERQIRTLLSTVFTRAGFRVSTASNGNDAVNLCGQQQFDVVLSDVVMPGMNGHELIRWLAVNRPLARTILMTGHDAKCDTSTNSPACEIVSKPFNPLQVVDTVKHVLAA